DQFTPFQSALSILLNWLGTYLLYRFALGLPGVCIGDDIGITDSFRYTKLLAIPLLWLTALSGVLTAIIKWVGQLAPAPAQFGLLLDTGLFFIQALIGASILTTLYGHLVQNRALPGLPAKAP
ncbi:MAG: hypothetical protein HRU30_02330, partial [Rhodobacteraceae bacterium]|nr:hypothetical protein [Paracoccaceae bacterium]